MRRFITASTVLCAALLATTFVPRAIADDWNKKTTVTFSGPVEIPGVHLQGYAVLPAGTYVFKLLSSDSDRHIVQIFSEDEKTVFATILAIPNYRLQATDKTVITFRERPAGEPEALRAWFYPGMNSGEEFVYPKAKAMELSKSTNTPVLFMPAEIPVEVTKPVKSAAEPFVVQLKTAPIMAMKPTGEAVPFTEVVTAPPAQPQVAMAAALPATASSLPLTALFGFLALAGAFGLWIAAKRIA